MLIKGKYSSEDFKETVIASEWYTDQEGEDYEVLFEVENEGFVDPEILIKES